MTDRALYLLYLTTCRWCETFAEWRARTHTPKDAVQHDFLREHVVIIPVSVPIPKRTKETPT